MDPRTHLDLTDAAKNPLAEPVYAAPGDVVIFTEGLTHNAFPVLDNSRRRSLFFNWVPSIDRDVSALTSAADGCCNLSLLRGTDASVACTHLYRWLSHWSRSRTERPAHEDEPFSGACAKETRR